MTVRAAALALRWTLDIVRQRAALSRGVRRGGRAPDASTRSPISRSFRSRRRRTLRATTRSGCRGAARAGRPHPRVVRNHGKRPSSATRTTSYVGGVSSPARSARPAGAPATSSTSHRLRAFHRRLGAHYGAEKLGCTVIPMSGHDRAAGPADPGLPAVDPHGDAVVHASRSRRRCAAEDRSDVDVAEDRIFGASRGPTRCAPRSRRKWRRRGRYLRALRSHRPGRRERMHRDKDGPCIWEDHFYPGDRGSADRSPVADGEMGELVFTSLTKEALRSSATDTRPTGCCRRPRAACAGCRRSPDAPDDMMIIRGVNVFPTPIRGADPKQPVAGAALLLRIRDRPSSRN